MTSLPKILGISASLRNARWGVGKSLVESLNSLQDENELLEFLKEEIRHG